MSLCGIRFLLSWQTIRAQRQTRMKAAQTMERGVDEKGVGRATIGVGWWVWTSGTLPASSPGCGSTPLYIQDNPFTLIVPRVWRDEPAAASRIPEPSGDEQRPDGSGMREDASVFAPMPSSRISPACRDGPCVRLHARSPMLLVAFPTRPCFLTPVLPCSSWLSQHAHVSSRLFSRALRDTPIMPMVLTPIFLCFS